MKLEVEYKASKFSFVKNDDGFYCFVDVQGNEHKELTSIYRDLANKEEDKHSLIDYWWESQASLARRAVENAGIKILEFEDDECPAHDEDGNPILY